MYSARTDLAIEAHEMYSENASVEAELDGIAIEREAFDHGINVNRVKVSSLESERAIGKPIGNYITLEIPTTERDNQTVYEAMCRVTAKELDRLIDLDPKDAVLVVGLGNWNITADALGPKVVNSLMVTRHLVQYIPNEIDERVRPVCAISPGVLGLTGIETSEIIKGVTEKVKPKVIIAIDALCSRNVERINATIQIADTGITPGAGLGNNRAGLNMQTLGVPVIAIGVPTVVDGATIAGDAIDFLMKDLQQHCGENENLYKFFKDIESEDKYSLIKNAMSPTLGDLIVTPKEVDSAIDDISSIIANGINISMHPGITLTDIDKYV